MSSYDLLVIGGGPGGLLAALRAEQSGLDVVLAEKNKIGGACLNRGCIPSKSLKTAAEIAHKAEESSDLGIEADPEIDCKRMMKWTSRNIRRLRAGSKKRVEKAGVDIKEAKAELVSSSQAEIDGETVEFENAIIASGSEPVKLPFCSYDKEETITSDEFFDMKELPEKIVIIGAGYIGMELGTICNKLGTDVTILEALDQILPQFDERVVKPIAKKAKKLGMDIRLDRSVCNVEKGEKVAVECEDEKVYSADQVMVLCGRKPVTDGLGLENTDMELDDGGFVKTDDQFKTDDPRIYAVGDVAGGKMLAHEAYNEAVIAVESILGNEKQKSLIPAVVFTDPQLAKVGEFKEEYVTGSASFREVAAAYTKNEIEGKIKVAIDDEGILKAGTIVGVEASEIIHELALAVQNELPAEAVADTVHAHPTVSEGILLAVEDALDSGPLAL